MNNRNITENVTFRSKTSSYVQHFQIGPSLNEIRYLSRELIVTKSATSLCKIDIENFVIIS